MTLSQIFLILIVHWIADFVFQAEEWATNKSKSNFALFQHVITYSWIWLFGSCILFVMGNKTATSNWYIFNSLMFSLITFVCHFITDYITSRIVSRKFANKHFGSPIPNFGAFTIIGIDQIFHYVQLFVTYQLLLNFMV